LSKDSTNLLYTMCDIHIYISEDILGYVITLPLVNRGSFKLFKMIPISMELEHKRFLYINTDESILCLDQTRQYYFMLNEDLNHCKVTIAGSYLCKQRHPLMSSHSRESCAVKMLQPRSIPKICDTRIKAKQSRYTPWRRLGGRGDIAPTHSRPRH
jgi:hypothetical protein